MTGGNDVRVWTDEFHRGDHEEDRLPKGANVWGARPVLVPRQVWMDYLATIRTLQTLDALIMACPEDRR